MANLRDIRRRIKSVKNTAQITKAMQLVAAAKMKKAQDQALSGRSYADALDKLLSDLSQGIEEGYHHPLLESPESGKELAVVISTDKGLCGGLNTNLLKAVLNRAPQDADYVTIGSKLRRSLAKLGRNIVVDFNIKDPVPFLEARRVAKFVTEAFLEKKYSSVKIYYTKFVSTLTQKPDVVTLLPFSHTSLTTGEIAEVDQKKATSEEFIFEPNAAEVLEGALPQYINFTVYQAVLEARASEHSSRMVAMKSATDNAKGMVKELTLEYNKLRQAAITNELLEITTAQLALA